MLFCTICHKDSFPLLPAQFPCSINTKSYCSPWLGAYIRFYLARKQEEYLSSNEDHHSAHRLDTNFAISNEEKWDRTHAYYPAFPDAERWTKVSLTVGQAKQKTVVNKLFLLVKRKHFYQGGTNLCIDNCQDNQMLILRKCSAKKTRFEKVSTTKSPFPLESHHYFWSKV